MKVVVDTNIIFSSLIRSESHIRDILFLEDDEFYSCKFAITELFENKEKLLKYTKLKEENLLEALHKILKTIHFINEEFISYKNLFLAHHLCKHIDEKDTLFVALALELDAVLWTGDKELKNGLVKKGFNKFYK